MVNSINSAVCCQLDISFHISEAILITMQVLFEFPKKEREKSRSVGLKFQDFFF